MVRFVNGDIDPLQDNEVTLNPFTEDVIPSYAAMNSDSVDEVVMVSWSCDLYVTVAPTSFINDPVNERRVQMQEASSALLMPCAV